MACRPHLNGKSGTISLSDVYLTNDKLIYKVFVQSQLPSRIIMKLK
ncbi:hypothetical protein [Paenibacillus sp. MMS20-IR301]|nr:hypothetical protein [Paenibacillus sp. MMS20-IR301]WNS46260.1 hypothetical protein LOS79_13640 [Paenibacillus sp. MMS20-IR301]